MWRTQDTLTLRHPDGLNIHTTSLPFCLNKLMRPSGEVDNQLDPLGLEVSSPCSQQPVTRNFPVLDERSPHPFTIFI